MHILVVASRAVWSASNQKKVACIIILETNNVMFDLMTLLCCCACRAIIVAAAPGEKLPHYPEPTHCFSPRPVQLAIERKVKGEGKM